MLNERLLFISLLLCDPSNDFYARVVSTDGRTKPVFTKGPRLAAVMEEIKSLLLNKREQGSVEGSQSSLGELQMRKV